MAQTRRRDVRGLAPLNDFLHTEAASGALLVLAAIAALVWANSPWSGAYDSLWHTDLSVSFGGHGLSLDLRHWVNDGAMAIFFLVVGLEIKREVTSGHLAGRRAAALPVAAALGGMVVPALVYLAIAGRTAAGGWGIPMATDIALAVGVLALAGPSVPTGLRAFLLGLAVVDDIGAIVVIAVFYSSGVGFGWLAVAAAALGATLVARRFDVHHLGVYLATGTTLWFALHEAGVHPTLAGVAMGLLTPAVPRRRVDLVDVEEMGDLTAAEQAAASSRAARDSVSTVEWLEHAVHPWTSLLIVPVFALANAGVVLSGSMLRDAIGSPITWGVLLGLLLGKPVGVLLASHLATSSRLADPPAGTRPRHVLGAGHAAGIGFTVALFIAELAFRPRPGVDAAAAAEQIDAAKLAIVVASLVSGLLAFAVLRARRDQSSESSPDTSASPSR